MLRRFGFTLAACAFAVVPAALAQTPSMQTPPILYQPDPDSPIGVMHESAPPETAQLDFLIGDWAVDIVFHKPAGDLAYSARWHTHWIVDGHAIMQEWRGPYATGAEIRSYNDKAGRWEGRNFYAGRQTWTESTGTFEDGDFVVTTAEAGPNGAFINKERYYDIGPDSFRMMAVRSYDDGETWSEAPVYEMTCTRIG